MPRDCRVYAINEWFLCGTIYELALTRMASRWEYLAYWYSGLMGFYLLHAAEASVPL